MNVPTYSRAHNAQHIIIIFIFNPTTLCSACAALVLQVEIFPTQSLANSLVGRAIQCNPIIWLIKLNMRAQ